MHCQARVVDLHLESGRDDAFVFLAHGFGDRQNMFVVGLVVRFSIVPAQLEGETDGTNTPTGSEPPSAALIFARSSASCLCPIYLIGPVQANFAWAEPEWAPPL
jgi:hypothetical protein